MSAVLLMPAPMVSATETPDAVMQMQENKQLPVAGTGSRTEAEDEFVIEDGVLTKYTGDAAEVVIPEGVTSIGAEAFYQCSNMTSVEIPNSVVSIEDFAFFGCNSLTSVEIPDSVINIRGNTFDD